MSLRQKLAAVIDGSTVTRFIITLILINAVTLGLETDADIMARHGALLHAIDRVILWIFAIEVGLRLFAYGLPFFRKGWNIFDFTIVAISFIPAAGPFAIVRTLRVLRVLRLISVVPKMRKVITALLSAIPGMTSVFSVLLIIFYVSAVMTTQIFGAADDPQMKELFGSIGVSMFTLFQLMTLEGWSENIAQPTMDIFPRAWIFFISFIIITTFAVLNLFIGIIVDAMNLLHDEERSAEVEKAHSEEMKAIFQIREDIASLRDELKKR